MNKLFWIIYLYAVAFLMSLSLREVSGCWKCKHTGSQSNSLSKNWFNSNLVNIRKILCSFYWMLVSNRLIIIYELSIKSSSSKYNYFYIYRFWNNIWFVSNIILVFTSSLLNIKFSFWVKFFIDQIITIFNFLASSLNLLLTISWLKNTI